MKTGTFAQNPAAVALVNYRDFAQCALLLAIAEKLFRQL